MKIREKIQKTVRKKVEQKQRKTEGERESLGYSKIDKEMYVSFRKYKTTKERREKTTELRSAQYICAGEISSRDSSEGSQGSH